MQQGQCCQLTTGSFKSTGFVEDHWEFCFSSIFNRQNIGIAEMYLFLKETSVFFFLDLELQVPPERLRTYKTFFFLYTKEAVGARPC